MDEGWEAGLHVGRGRVKQAIRDIVFNRIKTNGESTPTRLDVRLRR